MSQIILDFGSAETCQNDPTIIKRMIDELVKVDTGKYEIIIKWQLFKQKTIPHLKALHQSVFGGAYHYAKKKGYQTTASAFDEESLYFLLGYDIPFVKIAANPKYWWLGYLINKNHKIYISVPTNRNSVPFDVDMILACIRKYPATMEDYVKEYITTGESIVAISDHTADFNMFNKWKPIVYETHYKLSDSIGKDSGPWAKTPEQLQEIL
jgi:sialic acid synthase SpsE